MNRKYTVFLWALLTSCSALPSLTQLSTAGQESPLSMAPLPANSKLGSSALSIRLQQNYEKCPLTASRTRKCSTSAMRETLLTTPSLSTYARRKDGKGTLNWINKGRAALIQACQALPKDSNELTDTCSKVKGDQGRSETIGVLRDIFGTGLTAFGNELLGLNYILEFYLITLAMEAYDRNPTPWHQNNAAEDIEPFQNKRDFKNVSANPIPLSAAEKESLRTRYDGSQRFPMALVSEPYLQKVAFDSFKFVKDRHQAMDCVLRTLGVGLQIDPKPLYDVKTQFGPQWNGIPFSQTPEAMDFLISKSSQALRSESYISPGQWPTMRGDYGNSGPLAEALISSGGLGTYLVAVYSRGTPQRPAIGHALLLTVFRDLKNTYRIFSHDFTYYIQYEGFPKIFTSDTTLNPQKDLKYSFIKMSNEIFPLDEEAINLPKLTPESFALGLSRFYSNP